MNAQRQPRRRTTRKTIARPYRRRGSSYAFFLGMAMLVTIIGMSALAVMRINLRASEGGHDSSAARLYAQSAVEAALLDIYADTGWRDAITHGAWQSTQLIGDGSFTWKLVDEAHLSFTTDRNAPVRVYGQGVSGESVWIYSVLVQSPLESLSSNTMVNSDLETGAVAPWAPSGWCVLEIDKSTPRGGAACLLVTGRTAGSAASQSIAGLTSGTSHRSSVWAKMSGSTEDVWFGLSIKSDAGWEYFEFGQAQVGASWTELTGTTTPTWSGALLQALWIVGTDTTAEFYVDDASLVSAPTTIGPLLGTWRREML